MRFFNAPGLLPIFLLAGFVLAYMVYLAFIFYRARKTRSSSKGVIYKLIIRSSVFILLLLSFLGPLIKDTETPLSYPAKKQIFLAFDLTSSMKQNDLQPNRLKRSIHVAKQIVEGSTNSQFGIITFSSLPYIYSPLTDDKDAIINLLSSINESLLVSGEGSVIEPILVAGEKFSGNIEQTERILVVFSDSETYPDSLIINNSAYFNLIPVLTKATDQPKKVTAPHLFYISNETDVKLLLSKITNTNKISEEILLSQTENVYNYFLLPALLLLLLDCLVTVNVLKI